MQQVLNQPKDKHLTITHWKSVSGKTYRIPKHDLCGCGKYFETKYPKTQARYKQRKFFTLEECKEMEGKLTCGIKIKPVEGDRAERVDKQKTAPIPVSQPKPEPKVEKAIRPPLAAHGNTHFVYVPLGKELLELYQDVLQPIIKEELVPLEVLHTTLLHFRLEKDEDLNSWAGLVKDSKKRKITIKGLGMIGEKDRYARRLYLNVGGLDDLADTIVGRATEKELLKEADNVDRMRFDKATQTYKLVRPHVTVLRTQGKDLVDAKDYLKTFKEVAGPTIALTEVRIAVLDSYRPGLGFYDERVIKL